MAQGPLSASSTMRGLHSTASCTPRASGHVFRPPTRSPPPLRPKQSDNSGELALHHHHYRPVNYHHQQHHQQRLYIMAPPRLGNYITPCFFKTYTLPPPLSPMSPALTSVRAFSTKPVDHNNSALGSPVPNTTANAVASKKFTYQISAAYSAKQKRFSPTTNVFHYNPYNRVQDTAKRKSRPDAGQDAFFVSRINDTGAVAAGVVRHITLRSFYFYFLFPFSFLSFRSGAGMVVLVGGIAVGRERPAGIKTKLKSSS